MSNDKKSLVGNNLAEPSILKSSGPARIVARIKDDPELYKEFDNDKDKVKAAKDITKVQQNLISLGEPSVLKSSGTARIVARIKDDESIYII